VGQDAAHGAFFLPLQTLKDQHVVDFFPRLGDAGDHADQEHPADCPRVLVIVSTKVRVQPSINAPRRKVCRGYRHESALARKT
jgi:hypothetical protein